MKLVPLEGACDYESYSFSWRLWCTLDAPDELLRAYEMGFLPASHLVDRTEPIFYLARGLRVRLSDFEYEKNDRYIERKIGEQGIMITSDLRPLANLEGERSSIMKFCGDSMAQAAPGSFNEARVDYIFNRSLATHAIQHFEKNRGLVGVGILVIFGRAAHLWYNFYADIGNNIGKYLLLRAVRMAKDLGKEVLYLGTAYGENSRYKLVRGAEFFDEGSWSRDMDVLKKRWTTDNGTSDASLPPTGSLTNHDWMRLNING